MIMTLLCEEVLRSCPPILFDLSYRVIEGLYLSYVEFCFCFFLRQIRPYSDQTQPNQTRYQTYSGNTETTDDQIIIAFHFLMSISPFVCT